MFVFKSYTNGDEVLALMQEKQIVSSVSFLRGFDGKLYGDLNWLSVVRTPRKCHLIRAIGPGQVERKHSKYFAEA